jgi:hypothetical protein
MGASGAPIISNRNDQFYTKKLKYPAAKERGRDNFLNYASQLQATFARSQIPKASK